MAESATIQGYHVLVPADVAAKQVVVTPSTPPVRGLAKIEATHMPTKRVRDLSAAVAGVTLVIALPLWARSGNIVHWTSYES